MVGHEIMSMGAFVLEETLALSELFKKFKLTVIFSHVIVTNIGGILAVFRLYLLDRRSCDFETFFTEATTSKVQGQLCVLHLPRVMVMRSIELSDCSSMVFFVASICQLSHPRPLIYLSRLDWLLVATGISCSTLYSLTFPDEISCSSMISAAKKEKPINNAKSNVVRIIRSVYLFHQSFEIFDFVILNLDSLVSFFSTGTTLRHENMLCPVLAPSVLMTTPTT